MVVWIIVAVAMLFFGALLLVFDICFSGNKKYMAAENEIPQGEQYEPHRELMRRSMNFVLQHPYEEVSICSDDGLKLSGRYYHRKDGAPLVIFMHGYRGSWLRDGNGIFIYSKKLGYNILIVDQRAHGKSEGRTITFGIKERYDCIRWIEWALERFGEDTKLVLSGISMGAATVLMTADMNLPKQVKGIIADCPFSSPKAIIRKVIKEMHYPVSIVYGLAKVGAKLMGGFDIEETSAVEAVTKSTLPILIIHGDDDRFVPCAMSKECLMAGQEHVELVIIEGAGHGLSSCVDARKYEETLMEFFRKTLGE